MIPLDWRLIPLWVLTIIIFGRGLVWIVDWCCLGREEATRRLLGSVGIKHQ